MADNDRDPGMDWLPEASNPTREFPAQEYPTQDYPTRGGGEWSTPNHPSAPGYPMANYPATGYSGTGYSASDSTAHQQTDAAPEKSRRTVGLASAAVAGVSLLAIGLGGGYLLAGDDGDVVPQSFVSATTPGQAQLDAQSPGSAALAPSAELNADGDAPDTGSPDTEAAGKPSLASTLGAAVGTVSSINGASFIVHGLDGVICHVTTTNSTRVATLRGSGGVRNLSVGDPVFVKGSGGSDGVITADLVIAGAFPDLGAGAP